MDTPRNESYTTSASNTEVKDNMGLTANQRLLAWVALAAGVIALVWGMMRDPNATNGYNTSSGTEQRDAAANRSNTP